MRVMEEQAKAEFVAQAEQQLRKARRVPLVQDDHVRTAEQITPLIKVRQVCRVGANREIGIKPSEVLERALALGLLAQVVDGPLVLGLEYLDGVAEALHGREQAAQKVRVAVVPIGTQRVCEVGEV